FVTLDQPGFTPDLILFMHAGDDITGFFPFTAQAGGLGFGAATPTGQFSWGMLPFAISPFLPLSDGSFGTALTALNGVSGGIVSTSGRVAAFDATGVTAEITRSGGTPGHVVALALRGINSSIGELSCPLDGGSVVAPIGITPEAV